MVGQSLSHYRILEKLGQGGMGEVYLAEDTKLGRQVALKVLPPELADNEERRRRFEREARAIAALNHPNIVMVFSVEQEKRAFSPSAAGAKRLAEREHVGVGPRGGAQSIHFITMELVRGKSLSELLPRNGFPLKRFFEIAIPLADAVAAAHQEGITHRDLKPDNVMVSDQGRVKVLDFGLAKLRRELMDSSASDLPTRSGTQEGRILGTVHYMSPEQAEGKPVDARSDIFSLGILFYEMLTGERPFRGDTANSVLSAIIKDTPDSITDRRRDIPRDLAKIVRRCLAKESTRRFQSALDLRNELEELRTEVSSGELQEVLPRAQAQPINKWLAVATVMLFLLLAGISVHVLRTPAHRVPRLVNPIQVTSAVGLEDHPTWSPDGERLAYESNQSGNWDIWVSQLGGGEAVNLTAAHAGDDRYPSWSPDGRQIAFLSHDGESWSLNTMPSIGGGPRRVSALPAMPYGPSGAPQWSADGTEIALLIRDGADRWLEIVSPQTLATRRIPLPGSGDLGTAGGMDLSWSRDGRAFAYVDAMTWASEVHRISVVRSSGGKAFEVTDGRTNDWSPTWSTDGRKLFFVSNRGGTMDLWQQRFGSDALPEGEPEPVTAGVGMRTAVFSPDGARLAYSQGRIEGNVWRVPLLRERPATWADAEQITLDNAWVQFFDLSPDGKRLAVSSDRSGNQDVWTLASEGGELTQLTTDPTPDWAPRWSPDGAQIAFYAYRSGNRDIWVLPARGGPARQLTSHPAIDELPVWSPDGRQIAFVSLRSGNRDVWVMDAQGGEPRQVTVDPAEDYSPEWSPDSTSLVFASQREDQTLYRIWQMPVAGGEAELLSERRLVSARWSPDGRALYFASEDELWALSLAERLEYRVADLKGRRGVIGQSLAMDQRYLYFTWEERRGDIWVMDVVPK